MSARARLFLVFLGILLLVVAVGCCKPVTITAPCPEPPVIAIPESRAAKVQAQVDPVLPCELRYRDLLIAMTLDYVETLGALKRALAVLDGYRTSKPAPEKTEVPR